MLWEFFEDVMGGILEQRRECERAKTGTRDVQSGKAGVLRYGPG